MVQANPSAPAVIRGATVTEEDGGRLNAFASEPRMLVVDADNGWGFHDRAEKLNGRLAMLGFIALLATELALGGDVRVATPDGEATVTVPPGMAVGRSLRLKGKGWPQQGGRGDLLLSLSLKQPASYSAEERQLLEQLRAARSSDPRADWISSARL